MTSLVLPQESNTRLRFFNTVYGAHRDLLLKTGDDVYQVRLLGGVAEVDAALSFEVTGSTSGGLWVSLSEASKAAGLEAWLGSCQLDDLPEGLSAMVLDAYLAVTLDTLGARIGESFQITQVRRGPPPEELEYRLPFVLTTDDEQCVQGTLNFQSSWTSTIEKMLSFVPVMDAQSFQRLRILAPIEVGAVSLTVAELCQLKPQDVVLLDSSDWLTRQRVTIRVPEAIEMSCLVADDRLEIETVHEGQLSGASCASSTAALDDVRLPLSVQWGCASVTCDQLSRLAEGDALEHGNPGVQTVDLVLSGRAVGRGELLCSGDRIGVRLLSLSPSSLRDAVAEPGDEAQPPAHQEQASQ